MNVYLSQDKIHKEIDLYIIAIKQCRDINHKKTLINHFNKSDAKKYRNTIKNKQNT